MHYITTVFHRLKTNINKVLLVIVASAFVLQLVILILFHYSDSEVLFSALPPPFQFVPAAPTSLEDCDQLFGPDTAAATFEMSPDYYAGLAAFEAAINRSIGDEVVEGFTFQVQTQFKVLHYLTSWPNISSVCETGFNLGHSAFNYLTANHHSIVHSFDIGEHKYARKMARFMRRQFPRRFFSHFGNSVETVPEFARTHPNHRCNFIYVDGGHTYQVAMADLFNLASMADMQAGNVIMFDDYPTVITWPIGWAWENMRRWGYVQELMRCWFKSRNFYRGFVIGKVVRQPHLST